jgi:hypothetical protein
MNNATAETETEKRNKAAVQAAFDAWHASTGGPFTPYSWKWSYSAI